MRTKTYLLLLLVLAGALLDCEGGRLDIDIPSVDYYVAPDGDDSNPGTFDEPWATWHKAFVTAQPGDTVYFRGGVYPLEKPIYLIQIRNSDGTPEHPICFFNYPGEVPILDGDKHHPKRFNTGIELQGMSYLHFRGLVIRRLWQFDSSIEAVGFSVHSCKGIVLENISVHDIGGVGIKVYQGDDIHLINCDAYNCADPFNPTTARPGGKADGFGLYNLEHANTTYYVRGCRAWNCSDDGFNTNSQGMVYFDSCWAIANGLYQGDGNGFKYGGLKSVPPLSRSLTNCLSVLNRFAGYNENNNHDYNMNLHVYNCGSYGNRVGFQNFKFYIGDMKDNIYRNNVSYKDSSSAVFYGRARDEHNSWTMGHLDIDDRDFQSLDVSQLTRPRKPDGSLPDVDFMKLTKGSDLIDAGVDVGMPYLGKAPEMGYHERE